MKIAIIGAGLAGLAAADVLAQNGHVPYVLEARSRVGGRSWSDRLDDERVVERGGEFIYATDFAVRNLAARFRLPIVSHGVRFARRTVSGDHVSARELANNVTALTNTCTGMIRAGHKSPALSEVAEETFGAAYRSHPVFLRIATSLAGDPDSASAYALFHGGVDRFIADEGRLLDGNQQVSESLAASLPAEVQFESVARAVDSSTGGRVAIDINGVEHVADGCILAVPLPLLEKIEFGFDPSEELQRAISHLSMGVAAKISFALDETEAPDPALQDQQRLWWTWQSLSRDGETRIPLLTGFAGGDATLDALQVSAGPTTWLREISDRLKHEPHSTDPIFTNWEDDEWASGCYSYRTVGWQPNDLDALQRPIAANIVLAGEHTGLHATMNGAVESGQRAAGVLLQNLDSQ